MLILTEKNKRIHKLLLCYSAKQKKTILMTSVEILSKEAFDILW